MKASSVGTAATMLRVTPSTSISPRPSSPPLASVLIFATIALTLRSRTTSPLLVELLFGAYRRRILSLLLLHPEQGFYVREIARLTGVPAGSLHREVTQLTEAGLLSRMPAGNQVRYQADRSCPIFEELAGIFRKTSGLADVLRDALQPLERSVEAAFVFGSVAQGKEGPTSDVDVMVLGKAKFEKVVGALATASERLRREVNPVVMAPDEFRAKAKARDRFVTRILAEPKIMLKGEPGELGKPRQDRAA